MKGDKAMRKRIISAMAILALMIGTATMQQAKAQIVYMDNEEEIGGSRTNSGTGSPEFPNVPNLDVTYDQLAPVGEGLVVLAVLGGAYLIGKKRKEN